MYGPFVESMPYITPTTSPVPNAPFPSYSPLQPPHPSFAHHRLTSKAFRGPTSQPYAIRNESPYQSSQREFHSISEGVWHGEMPGPLDGECEHVRRRDSAPQSEGDRPKRKQVRNACTNCQKVSRLAIINLTQFDWSPESCFHRPARSAQSRGEIAWSEGETNC